MTDIDKQRLMEASSILRSESRNYYDKYCRLSDSNQLGKARDNFEKYQELNKLAAELDIIAGGL